MKTILLKATAPALVSLLVLGGCGGGDDDLAGGNTEFSVQPAEITWTAATGATTCYAGPAGNVTIVGGAPPYKLSVSFPADITLSTTQVSDWGGAFSITYTGGGCFDPATVTVTDSLKRTVTLTLTNTIGTGT